MPPPSPQDPDCGSPAFFTHVPNVQIAAYGTLVASKACPVFEIEMYIYIDIDMGYFSFTKNMKYIFSHIYIFKNAFLLSTSISPNQDQTLTHLWKSSSRGHTGHTQTCVYLYLESYTSKRHHAACIMQADITFWQQWDRSFANLPIGGPTNDL